MIPSDIRLYTWIDVEDVLLRWLQDNAAPDWFVDARAYWDSLVVRVRTGSIRPAQEWTTELFEPRITWSSAEGVIALESEDAARGLPVSFEETDEPARPASLVPTFGRPSLVEPSVTGPFHPPPFEGPRPAVFAFHSFKGGVGRTLHALALAQLSVDRHGSVLLVDADLEAPGISWLLSERLPSPPVSFSDLLALAHGDADPTSRASVALVANRLQDSRLDGIFVLPAYRSPQVFHSLEIRPEHLLRGSAGEFVLTRLLRSLGAALGVDSVIVDLRAGVSELAAGLLMDPRIARVFVTSLGGQSLNGTETLLGLLAKRSKSVADDHPIPTVIVNQVPLNLKRSEALSDAEERILGAADEMFNRDLEPSDVLRGPTYFDESFLSLPSSWDEVLTAIRRSRIKDTVSSIADLLPVGTAAKRGLPIPDVEDTRRVLVRISKELVFAETKLTDDFLSIEPLRNLVEGHRAKVPIAVVVGAKGSGKTFTYLQMVLGGTWPRFASRVVNGRETVDAVICPVLEPLNLSEETSSLLRTARAAAVPITEGTAFLDGAGIRDRLRGWLEDSANESKWRERWLDLMAWAAGFEPEREGAGRRLPAHLDELGKGRIVFVFDGLEDTFQQVSSERSQQVALRALLQEVPAWLDQQPNRRVGILVFVRRDMVLAAIPQNSAQMLARYERFALKWDAREALRLVAWVATKAGIQIDLETGSDASEAELTDALDVLWGRKLGKDDSREGRSAEWVLAALSDFHGQVQARDLIRLLHNAGERPQGTTQWTDRILSPSAVRAAVNECSRGKLDEVKQENPELGVVFDKLRKRTEDKRVVPFESDDLTPLERQTLERNGVIMEDQGRWYMAEVFRRGLDFKLPKGARPKVLALRRKRASE